MNLDNVYWCRAKKAQRIWEEVQRTVISYEPDKPLHSAGFEEIYLPHSRFSIMYGQKVSKHLDPHHYIQPLLILQNDDRWCFKSPSQTVRKAERPKPGYMTFLQVDKLHEVTGRKGKRWVTLGWSSKFAADYANAITERSLKDDLDSFRRQFRHDLHYYCAQLGIN